MPPPYSVEIDGWAIARDAAGAWTMTAPASLYGWDSVEQMVAEDGFAPEAMPLDDAGFANAPFTGKILAELCSRLERTERMIESDTAAAADADVRRPTFHHGQRVRLRVDGPTMIALVNPLAGVGAIATTECVWADHFGQLHRKHVPTVALEAVPEGEA